MGFFSRTFGVLRPAWLFRAYVISVVFFTLVAWMQLQAATTAGWTGQRAFLMGYFVLCLILFPFAKLAWEELRNLVLGNNILFLNAIVMLMLKLMVSAALWMFTPFIAPLMMLYLWLSTRQP